MSRAMKVKVAHNDDRAHSQVITVPPDTTMAELLKLASHALGFSVVRLYHEGRGEPVSNPAFLSAESTIVASSGDAFKNAVVKGKCPLYSVAVMGPGSVGKSAMTLQFAQGIFVRDYDPTIEDAYRQNAIVDEQACVLDILDTAGQEDYVALRSTWMRERDGFILVFSVCDSNTFEEVNSFWDQLADMHEDQMPALLLVGNKCDLSDRRQVSQQEGAQLAEEFGCAYLETSAKTGLNVTEAFHHIIRQVRENLGTLPVEKKEKPKRRFWCSIL